MRRNTPKQKDVEKLIIYLEKNGRRKDKYINGKGSDIREKR